MFHHRIPVYYLFVTAVAVLALAFLAMREMPSLAAGPTPAPAVTAAPHACNYRVMRVSGYEGIRPLLFSEPECESPRFAEMKQDIARAVEEMRAGGLLSSASVYVRDFRKGEWTSYNDAEQFDPGSLLKVPLLMAYLRMQEDDPTVFSRRYVLWRIDPRMPKALFPPTKQIALGTEYTVRELLEYGIERSDNLAVLLLLEHVDKDVYQRTYTELGLAPVDFDQPRHPMTAHDYTVFMKALFNSSYLGIHHSEYAMSLLRRTDFREGLQRGLPATMQVAHKFGEYSDGTSMQLHDAGIVYLGDTPYAISIFTKGPDASKLPEAIGTLSGVVYQRMAGL